MNRRNNKNLWYSAGLHFECIGCGRCCSGPEAGYMWVTRPEIKLIARHLKISPAELKQKFLRRVGLRTTIIEDARTRDCVFLQKNAKGGKQCCIYPVRPAQCRSWPFWPGNLAGPGAWNETAKKCPGINKGKKYTPEQIKSLKDNKHWWRQDEKE